MHEEKLLKASLERGWSHFEFSGLHAKPCTVCMQSSQGQASQRKGCQEGRFCTAFMKNAALFESGT